MDNQFVLRRGNHADSEALSQLHRQAFQETFIEDFAIPYPEKDLESYYRSFASPEYFLENLNDPQRAIWVIEDQTHGKLIAYTLVGLCDVDDISHPDVCPNNDGAINRLYVLRDRRSYGFGRQLMAVVLLWLDEHFPARPIWLTVWSKNFRAQKFYQHYGFCKAGELKFAVGEWEDDEFFMKRSPSAS